MTSNKVLNLMISAVLGSSSLMYSSVTLAKRTADEQAVKDSQKDVKKADKVEKKQAKNSSTVDSRLIAKFRLDEVDGADEVSDGVEEEAGRELSLKYRSKKGTVRLDAEASNFPAGTLIEVRLNNVSLGILNVVQTAEALEGEISIRDENWPADIPKILPAGTIVSFIGEDGSVIAEGPLEPK